MTENVCHFERGRQCGGNRGRSNDGLVAEIFNPLLAGCDKPQTGYKLEASNEMLRETCQECERLLRDFDEIVQKTFRVEERLRHAKDYHYHALAKALAVRLAHLADERVRLNSLLIEHAAQSHPAAS